MTSSALRPTQAAIAMMAVLLVVAMVAGVWWIRFEEPTPPAEVAVPSGRPFERPSDQPLAEEAAATRTLPKDSATPPAENSDSTTTPANTALPSADESLELELRSRIVLTGFVRDSADRPVHEAAVWFDGEIRSLSGADGSYRFEADLNPTGARGQRLLYPPLLVRKPGVGVAIQPCPSKSQKLDIPLQRGHTVSGRVVERASQSPLPDAIVRCATSHSHGNNPPVFVEEVLADGEGSFTFVDLPSLHLSFHARVQGFGMARPQIEWVEQDLFDLELGLTALQTVTGQFSPWPPPRNPAPSSSRRGGESPALGLWLDTDLAAELVPLNQVLPDGRFRMQLTGRFARWNVVLRDAEQIHWDGVFEVPTRASDYDLGVLTLPETTIVEGTVTDTNRWQALSPKVRATIRSGTSTSTCDLPLQESGSFRGRLPQGVDFRLALALGSSEIGSLGDFETHGRDSLQVGTLSLKNPAILGVVTEHDGTSRAGIEVALERARPSDGYWATVAKTTTDVQGRYVLAPRSAVWQDGASTLRWVARYRHRRGPLILDVAPHPSLQRVIHGKFPPPTVLRGTLRDRRGNPLVGWTVTYQSLDGGTTLLDTTSPDGSFVLIDAEEERYDILLEAPSEETFELRNQPRDQTDLVCELVTR